MKKLLLASVAAVGLLLAGPQKASAEVIYACVSTIGNIAIVASASAPCPPNVGSATWIKINWNVNSGGQASNVLYTPTLAVRSPDLPLCNVLNVAAQTRSIRLELFDDNGALQGTPLISTLQPQQGTSLQALTQLPQDNLLFCKFTVTDTGGTSSDIRGAMQICSAAACSHDGLPAN